MTHLDMFQLSWNTKNKKGEVARRGGRGRWVSAMETSLLCMVKLARTTQELCLKNIRKRERDRGKEGQDRQASKSGRSEKCHNFQT